MYKNYNPFDLEQAQRFSSAILEALKCKHCKGVTTCIPGDYGGYTHWCCNKAREENEVEIDKVQISRLRSRGYKIEETFPDV